MQDKAVMVIGDFLLDVHDQYLATHKHYQFVDRKSFPGGAFATFEYALKLGGLNDINLPEHFIRYHANQAGILLRRQKFGNQEFTVLEYPEKWEEKIESFYNNIASGYSATLKKNKQLVLVVSDYNKGSLDHIWKNRFWTDMYETKSIFACVVDSRYRSTSIELLADAQYSIWHATGEEFDPAFAKCFDYTIHTNGPNPIEILNKDCEVVATLSIPQVEIVDTTGAGDCFTAAIATYLTQGHIQDIDTQILVNATYFAVTNCLEVVQTPYTAIPNFMIPINHWR